MTCSKSRKSPSSSSISKIQSIFFLNRRINLYLPHQIHQPRTISPISNHQNQTHFDHRFRDSPGFRNIKTETFCERIVDWLIGSILIDDDMMLTSHQIRTPCANKSDFYLRVRSKPRIEDGNGVRFAPYCLSYDGIEEDLKMAGLEEEENENWGNVDHFLWLIALQLPNWSVFPKDQRGSSVSISGDGHS